MLHSWRLAAVLVVLLACCSHSAFSQGLDAVHTERAGGTGEHTTGAGTEDAALHAHAPPQQSPIPDAEHQVAMQQAAEAKAVSGSDGGPRSPTVRVNVATTAKSPNDFVRSTTPGAVFLMTTAMGACSGLGALPFFFVGALSKEWAALANAVACGVMLAASFDLLHEGQPYGAGFVILGLITGALFINYSQQRLQQFEDVKFEGLKGANARKLVLFVGIMAAHALGEGSGVGVSFCGHRGWAQGLLVTLAIGLHNIPEGLAVATVLVGKGVSAKHAFWWAIFTSSPQPLLALPSFIFVDTFRALLPIALGFAAGCMLWMVFAELLPDALEDSKAAKVATAATFSAAWLEALRMMLAGLEQPSGALALPLGESFWVGMNTGVVLLLGMATAAFVAGGLASSAVTTGALSLAAASGILAWLGGLSMFDQLVFNPHAHFVETLLACGAGVAAAVLGHRWMASQHAESAALQDDGGLGKLANGVAHGEWDDRLTATPHTPFLLPVTNGDAHRVADDASDKTPESKRVFRAKKGGQVGAAGARGVSAALALLVLAAHGLAEGWRIAEATGADTAEAGRVLPPLLLRVAGKAVASAFLTGHIVLHSSVSLQATVAALVCSVAPVSAWVQIMRGAGPDSDSSVTHHAHGHWACLVDAGLTGMCLMVALRYVLVCARRMRARAAQLGFVLGLAGCGGLFALERVLCLSTVYCAVKLTAA